MKISKNVATILILILCIVSVQSFRAVFGPKEQAKAGQKDNSRSKGTPKAPLWIVEYMDFECHSCGLAAPVLSGYISRHPDEIYLQAKYFPISSHRYGFRSAQYAECASRQNKFWEFYEKVFAEQERWVVLPEVDTVFHDYARELGLDTAQLDSCLGDSSVNDEIMNDKKEAETVGVNSTPTFFINGKMIVGRKGFFDEMNTHFPGEVDEAQIK